MRRYPDIKGHKQLLDTVRAHQRGGCTGTLDAAWRNVNKARRTADKWAVCASCGFEALLVKRVSLAPEAAP